MTPPPLTGPRDASGAMMAAKVKVEKTGEIGPQKIPKSSQNSSQSPQDSAKSSQIPKDSTNLSQISRNSTPPPLRIPKIFPKFDPKIPIWTLQKSPNSPKKKKKTPKFSQKFPKFLQTIPWIPQIILRHQNFPQNLPQIPQN